LTWQVKRYSLDAWNLVVKINQIQTGATTFRMPLELRFYNGDYDTSYVVVDSLTAQSFSLLCDFRPDFIAVDPNNWVLKTVSYFQTEPPALPDEFHLYPPYPNPFNQSVTIKLDLQYNTRGRIEICDLLGREVAVIADGLLKGGSYYGNWSPQNLASGLYFVRFSDAHHCLHRKILYLK